MGLIVRYESIRTELNSIAISLKDASIFELEDHFMIIFMNKIIEPREVTLDNPFHMTTRVCTKYFITYCLAYSSQWCCPHFTVEDMKVQGMSR